MRRQQQPQAAQRATTPSARAPRATTGLAALSRAEWRTVATFACVFVLLLGGYWMVRPVKAGLFMALVGLEHEPAAKIGTMLVIVPVLAAYNRLLSWVKRPARTAAIVLAAYAALFAGVAALLRVPGVGLADAAGVATVPGAGNWLGWLAYWTIETYSSVTVPLYWGLVARRVPGHAAPAVFPVLVALAQIGAVGGSSVSAMSAGTSFGGVLLVQASVATLVALLTVSLGDRPAPAPAAATGGGGASVAPAAAAAAAPPADEEDDAPGPVARSATASSLSSRAVASATPASSPKEGGGKDLESADPRGKDKADGRLVDPSAGGAAGGVALIFSGRYMMGLAVVSTVGEVLLSMLDMQMKFAGREAFPDPKEFAQFMGRFGQAVNGASLAMSLLGTRSLVQCVGVRLAVLVMPLLGGLVVAALASGAFSPIWTLFAGAAAVKAMGYSVNNPVKEMLYLRTSDTVKLRSKGWIDSFGTRGAKAGGSALNGVLLSAFGRAGFQNASTAASSAVVAFWLVAARVLGVEHHRLEVSGEIVR